MKEPENPFTFRSSESIESRLTFLKLFGHTILDALPDDCLSRKVTIFRGSPGGGKTSLFRVFFPESLVEISRDQTICKELFHALCERGAIRDSAPALLGVYLRLHGYAASHDLDLSDEQNARYIFSLIGVRLIMKTLAGIMTLENLDSEQLHRITIQKPPDHCIAGISLPCNGRELYEWASKVEREIYGMINRFDVDGNLGPNNLGSSIADYIRVICYDNILLDGRPIAYKTLVLLDDLHELVEYPRKKFLDEVVAARLPTPIWIAERLEALKIEELNPDYGRESSAVHLEQYWEKGSSFEKFARLISERRTRHASLSFDIDLYRHLDKVADTDSKIFKKAVTRIKRRINAHIRGTHTYDNWIKKQQQSSYEHDDAISWRMLEIKIVRDVAQTKLDDTPLEIDQEDQNQGLKAAATFFVHREFEIPYFFDFSSITKLSTFNIEVFLKIAAGLFDEIKSQRIMDRNHVTLAATSQERIVKEMAQDYFDQIIKIDKSGGDMIAFLSAFQELADRETMKPNASYVPGITGIGIAQKHYDRMIDSYLSENDEKYDRLVEVLRSCIAHNYLSVKYDARQGKPGNKTVLLYLNRLLCAHFDLPLGKGGWRHKTPDELCTWLDPLAVAGKTGGEVPS